jgi:uncharacterized protein YegL
MKKGYTHVAFLLDRSGSMYKIKSDTIGGFNNFIKDQKKEEGECTFSMVQFDDEYEVLHDFEKIKDVSKLTGKSFVPRGWTALLDALGRSIVETGEKLSNMKEEDRPEKVLFIILTDGEENASKEYSSAQIMEKIKHQEKKYNWKFIYLGANQDAIKESAKYGISSVNTMSVSASAAGVGETYSTLSKTVTNVRGTDAQTYCSMDVFDEEDRKKQKDLLEKEQK